MKGALLSKPKNAKKSQKATKEPEKSPEKKEALPPGVLMRGVTAAGLGWMVPGAGHFILGRRGRAAFFFVWVLLATAIGCLLSGNLPWVWSGSPLLVLRTLGCAGSGLPFFILHFAGYAGDVHAAGYEYGGPFLVSAGLMNLLAALDAWDIALGRKS